MFGALEHAEPPTATAPDTITAGTVGNDAQPAVGVQLPTAMRATRPMSMHSAAPSAVAAGGC